MSSYVAFCRLKEGVKSLLLTNQIKKDQNPNLLHFVWIEIKR